ncbi:MAG TPA: ATP-grasp domain-containing protein [Anaeromyxobacteraceae bacterium]|jgi:biotin carboxylase|nr:ATP-grasp domain-containing protein [Anaeromyxobacteraceae bacterium]
MTAPRLLLLAPTQSYRTQDFLAAAARLGVEVVVGTDRCHQIEETFGVEEGLLSLDYRKPEHAAEQIAEAVRQAPIGGIVPVNETTAVIAALAAERLGLPWSPPEAARRAGDKAAQRARLREAGLPVPVFQAWRLDEDPERAAAAASYPCVLKPVVLSASRGVIRADDPAGFAAAWRRIERILREARTERRAAGAEAARTVLVEGFVPGAEVAVEGLLRGGEFELLALFDKPDPLDGPYFEETLYVTPSRHSEALQREIVRLTGAAARALGLAEGPVHAELRLSPAGPVILEVAARSIGGLCARTLRFGAGISLEELLVCHALRLPIASLQRERRAAGVMMIPIPRAGILHGVGGLEEARAVPGVEDVVVTARTGREVAPLPEGDCYFGFIFARAETPAEVEAALRAAHARLRIDIRPPLPTV